MTNMRRGFTMIELIFVIVIIGILAAVAIPKLAATRADAANSAAISDARTCVTDAQAYHVANGDLTAFTSVACTNCTGNAIVACVVGTIGVTVSNPGAITVPTGLVAAHDYTATSVSY